MRLFSNLGVFMLTLLLAAASCQECLRRLDVHSRISEGMHLFVTVPLCSYPWTQNNFQVLAHSVYQVVGRSLCMNVQRAFLPRDIM